MDYAQLVAQAHTGVRIRRMKTNMNWKCHQPLSGPENPRACMSGRFPVFNSIKKIETKQHGS